MKKITQTPLNYKTANSVLGEIWRIKAELSASYGHDVHRMFAEAREREKLSGHRVVNLQARRKKPVNGK